jgi:hypothetical protein
MYCEIARNLEGERLETLEALERDLGLIIVAFSCRALEPAREQKLGQIMEQLGSQLLAEPGEPDEVQLDRIRELEKAMGLSLVAVHP